MKYRIETQQVFGNLDAHYDHNAEWLEHEQIKPRGFAAAVAAMQAKFDNSGFKPPVRVVAVDAIGDRTEVARCESPHKPYRAPQSFFQLADMHSFAMNECINETRPFSFIDTIDCTGRPHPRSTYNYQPIMETIINTARAAGTKCYWDGGSLMHGNPHPDDTFEFSAWARGWLDAQIERWETQAPTAAKLLKSRTL